MNCYEYVFYCSLRDCLACHLCCTCLSDFVDVLRYGLSLDAALRIMHCLNMRFGQQVSFGMACDSYK